MAYTETTPAHLLNEYSFVRGDTRSGDVESFVVLVTYRGVRVGTAHANRYAETTSYLNPYYTRAVQRLADSLGRPSLRLYVLTGMQLQEAHRGKGIGSAMCLEVLHEVARRNGALVPHTAIPNGRMSGDALRVWARLREQEGVTSLGADAMTAHASLP